MTRTFATASIVETTALATRFGRHMPAGGTLGLVGPLGAGKTAFVRGLAAGAGVTELAAVTSPTFVLLHEYECPVPIVHVDAYRLKNPTEFLGLGLEEYLADAFALVVEWADRVREQLPADRLEMTIAATDATSRRFECSALGPKSVEWLTAVGE